MLAKNSANIIDLISFSKKLHNSQICAVKNYCTKEKNNTEKWFELIYSILVGVQMKTFKVKYCYEKLLNEYSDLLNPGFLKKLEIFDYLIELIKISLKNNGYRFYETKSITICNTILYFQKFNFNVNKFLNKYRNYKEIRAELVKIKGIGYKIASHWLRNLGYYIPVIDIHIKNLLFRFKLIKNKNLNYNTYEKIQNKLIKDLRIDNISFDLALWYYGKNFCGNRKCQLCKFYSICLK